MGRGDTTLEKILGLAASDETTDQEMASRALSGDTEAFGELIQRHREKAFRLAKSMTGDDWLAEDIVQEALIKAFLHVGQLVDPNRFAGWLKQIIRNETYMKLRRGGPYNREKPLTSYVSFENGDARAQGSDVLEKLLHQLDTVAAKRSSDTDPIQHLLRKDSIRLIRSLLHCLNERERGMFEAYFFMNCSAEEISALFNTTTGSVHTYLHRSKKKLQDAVKREHIEWMADTKPAPHNRRMLVAPVGKPESGITFIDRLCKMMQSRGEAGTVTDWMGRSGFAFRLKISQKTTYADGVFVFDWKQELNRLLMNYGYEPDFVTGQLEGLPIPLHPVAMLYDVVPYDVESVMAFVRRSIDRGSPVLFFDTYVERPYVHEWNLIYGYDDLSRTIELTDVLPPYRKTLRYEQLAASPLQFLCSVRKTNRPATRPEPLQAIKALIRYAREGDGFRSDNVHSCYALGLGGAYGTWIRHLKTGPRLANSYGHRYMASVYASAKAFAGRYVREIEIAGFAEEILEKAAAEFDQSACLLREVSALNPLHDTSGANWTKDILDESAALLDAARQAEERAILLLEQLCNMLNQRI